MLIPVAAPDLELRVRRGFCVCVHLLAFLPFASIFITPKKGGGVGGKPGSVGPSPRSPTGYLWGVLGDNKGWGELACGPTFSLIRCSTKRALFYSRPEFIRPRLPLSSADNVMIHYLLGVVHLAFPNGSIP